LVVEDDRDLSAVVETTLRETGHEVRVAYDGETALQIARAMSPDAVVLDLGLPDFEGYDISRAMRKKGILDETAVIVVVTGDTDADLDRAQAVGCDHLLRKPVSSAALADLIDYIHARRQRKPGL
jgi:DNA-binding response OmpR family regulator